MLTTCTRVAATAILLAWACSSQPSAPPSDTGHPPAPDAPLGRDALVDARLPAADAPARQDAVVVVDAPPPPPKAPWPEWAFHHWVWEDESTQQSALDLVDGYLGHGIPVGAIIIDSPWETGYNTLQWDPALFPSPTQMITALHGKNVRVMLWIVPAINTDVQPLYDTAKTKGYFMQQYPFGGPGVIDWWKGKGSLLDYFNPAAVAWWHTLLDQTLAFSIDGWKCDGVDFSEWLTPFSPGKGFVVARTDYSDAYYRDFFNYTRQKLGQDRIITARPVDTYGYDVGPALAPQAAFAPVDVSWAGWVGDQDPSFDGMRAALLNMYYSSQLGYLAFGSDIGGYREDKSYPNGRTKELFIRWAQLGAFCPVMENGGGGEHRPWKFDTQTTDIYRTFVKLHYAMIPYLMDEGAKAWQNKKSLMTFLDKVDYSYLLGPDIFVTPITKAGTTQAIKLPAGNDWVYLFDKQKVYAGGTSVSLDFPITELPVFLRKGSSIATTLTVVP